MKLRRILAIGVRLLYLMRGSPARILPLFAWVAIDIVLWGFITRFLGTVTHGEFNVLATFLGAVLLWDFFTRVMQGVTTAFFEDVWSRNFVNLFASPLSISEYVVGLILISVATSAVGLFVMLVLASVVFGLSFAAYGLMLLPFLLILFLFGIALGIFSIAIVLRLGPAAEWLIWPLPAIVSPFAGVFYPLDTLPTWMQVIGYSLPPSYVFEAMRAIVDQREFSGATLLFGGGLAMFDILVAAWLFGHIYRSAVRSGLLARYSAESAS